MNNFSIEEWYEWWNLRPENVLQLCEKIIENEIYFTDMSLNENGILKDYFSSPYGDFVEPPEELLIHSPSSGFKVHICDFNDYSGCVHRTDRILAIDVQSINNKEVILHEMIHAHEILLEEKNMLLRDALLFELYNKLKPLYSNLDKIIRHHANFYRYNQAIGDGGTHDILFLLKSLELDNVLGFTPGTVFGYDKNITSV